MKPKFIKVELDSLPSYNRQDYSKDVKIFIRGLTYAETIEQSFFEQSQDIKQFYDKYKKFIKVKGMAKKDLLYIDYLMLSHMINSLTDDNYVILTSLVCLNPSAPNKELEAAKFRASILSSEIATLEATKNSSSEITEKLNQKLKEYEELQKQINSLPKITFCGTEIETVNIIPELKFTVNPSFTGKLLSMKEQLDILKKYEEQGEDDSYLQYLTILKTYGLDSNSDYNTALEKQENYSHFQVLSQEFSTICPNCGMENEYRLDLLQIKANL